MTIVPGDVLANARAADLWSWRFDVAKLGKPVDKDEWLITPQTVNAYYYPRNERDHLPGGDPAAAVLRSECRRRRELRRHRRSHRPRNRPRLRRPGPALRRHRRAEGLVDQGRRRGVYQAVGRPGGSVQRVRSPARSQGERTAHARREHRRSWRPGRSPTRPTGGHSAARTRRSSTASLAISVSSWPTGKRGVRRCAMSSCARWSCPIRIPRRPCASTASCGTWTRGTRRSTCSRGTSSIWRPNSASRSGSSRSTLLRTCGTGSSKPTTSTSLTEEPRLQKSNCALSLKRRGSRINCGVRHAAP